MTIVIKTFVHCDHEKCNHNDGIHRDKPSAREIRKIAKESGWSRVGWKDYCPDHKPEWKRVLVPAGE